MTSSKTLVCKSLRELDAAIAIHLFGWKWAIAPNEKVFLLSPISAVCVKEIFLQIPPRIWDLAGPEWDSVCSLPPYTTWAGMETVVRLFKGKHYQIRHFYAPWNNAWAAELDPSGEDDWITRFASDLPIAFCLAALKTVGIDVTLEIPDGE